MRPAVLALVLAALVVAAVGAWRLAESRERDRLLHEARETTDAYLAALASADGGALADLTRGDDAGAYVDEAFAALEVTTARFAREDVTLVDGGAEARFTAALDLAGLGTWEYAGSVPLVHDDEEWHVAWSPSALHPLLREDDTLERTRDWPQRAAILDRDGGELEVDLLVGSVGELEGDDEQADGVLDHHLPGDPVGVSGLQATFERHLAGLPTGTVVAVSGERRTVLHEFPGDEPRPVVTTIDPVVQAAADAMTQGGPTPRVVVATDAETGELLAVSNWPRGGFNRAAEGRYPPGSTFKVVTAAAILRAGTGPDDVVGCPARYEVGGWGFRNFEEMALGQISFSRAVYDSCNTAFVALTEELDDDLLVGTVTDFGFGVDYRLPIPHRVGTFPEWENDTVKAAQGFGQGRVEAPPIHLASVAAAIAAGRWQPPLLVREPDWDPGAEPRDLSDVAPALQEMMSLVVTRGTAADARLPADVAGKTGTAEYGTGDPLPTHAWFIGYAPWQDRTVAFAVLVEEGEAGGRVAAPLARRFLATLRDGQ